jgi:hypothetical protein
MTPVILAELTRRSVVRLAETSQKIEVSSRRLEKLTLGLLALTLVLCFLALPPAMEELSKVFSKSNVSERAPAATPPKATDTQQTK